MRRAPSELGTLNPPRSNKPWVHRKAAPHGTQLFEDSLYSESLPRGSGFRVGFRDSLNSFCEGPIMVAV